ncbi:MAG: type II toxin-antitoxin system VapC family toxin [Acaryochloridaceae cyanobacterium CSU_3_4]|nr:type II toxin-antitoxin system VapC family toxin [Acaryochloridaceae cyanobacterium CSU_3_4]
MGSLTIPDGSLIYIDTSVIIYTIEQVPGYCTLLETLWDKFQAGAVNLFSSELLLLESLVLPLRMGNTRLVNAYENLLLSSSLWLVSISQAVLRDAAELRTTTRLKTPDAIHATTALRENCTLFLTNDRQFRTVAGLPVRVLEEVLQT